MQAYTEDYIDYAQDVLGTTFDYILNTAHLELETFIRYFSESRTAKLFATGNPHCILGTSGSELGDRIVREFNEKWESVPYTYELLKTREYWAGWILALYQWNCARSFKTILRFIPLEDILVMYNPYHEMPLESCMNALEKRFQSSFSKKETNLKMMRMSRGLSQTELSKQSDVDLRSIQRWEQKIDEIDRAQSSSIYRLAYVLNCNVEDLLEDPLLDVGNIPDPIL